jgi:hypothetical protein
MPGLPRTTVHGESMKLYHCLIVTAIATFTALRDRGECSADD